MASFTAKHYTAIAKVIHERRVAVKTTNVHRDGEPDAITAVALEAINGVTLALSKIFEQDNSKFKPFTFIEACNADLKDI